MSFAYLPLYTGDYLRDTRGLSMGGHGCYLLMLMYCWDTRGPLPIDVEEIATICGARSPEERTTMDRILKRYFVGMEDGHYNPRLQREIERCEAISRERSSAGRKGFQAKAKQMLSKSEAIVKQMPLSPSPSPSLSPTPEEPKPKAAPLALPDWLPPDLWTGWREHRTAARSRMTVRAEALCLSKLNELRSLGNDPKAIIEQSIERGWKSFYPLKTEVLSGKQSSKDAERKRVLDGLTGGR